MINIKDAKVFEEARPDLLGLAYRILGSLADAEDAVQDTFVKWANTDREKIESAPAWLRTVCTRRCIDLLRSAHRTRVNYVGAWLPEPVHIPVESDVENQIDLASSLTTAFLLMLERLTPRERAAYVLREIFDAPYPEIARALDIKETGCRKLVSRAKVNISHDNIRNKTTIEHQDRLLAAFQAAVTGGKTEELAGLLSNDIRLSADGGGKVAAILEVLDDKDRVISFLKQDLHRYWAGHEWLIANINGTRGIVLKHHNRTVAAVTFAYGEAGETTDIYIVRNPEKLVNLNPVAIH